MAEQRRAKKVNVNGVNGVQTGEDDGADREELAKARGRRRMWKMRRRKGRIMIREVRGE
jgi:hypothetical protein